MTRASFLLIALSLALPSCDPVSLGGSQGDSVSLGGSQDDGGTQPVGAGGNGGTGAIDTSAPGQGGGAGDAEWCQPRTFDVDCAFGLATYTCVQRGGQWVWDHSCPDAPSDGGSALSVDAAVALGCDPAKAAQAVSAAGLTISGEAQTMSVDLPSSLSASANWGVKESACRAGGYDLSAVAGESVCLVSFASTELCQDVPTDAWVVMSDDIVRCIYLAVRPGSPMTPGVYSVHDSTCSTADAAVPSCPGSNPAARTCRTTSEECIPSSCSCGASGTWSCTTDCLALPLCSDAGTDAGTCPGSNPAARTCRITSTECIPSSCSCGASGTWACTTDCLALPLCSDGDASPSGSV